MIKDKKRAKYSATPKGRAVIIFNKVKNRCKLKNKGQITVSVEWIEQKIKTGICELSGIPFDLNPDSRFYRNPFSPSLDRINNENRDYSPENTRVILTCLNGAINEYGLENFLTVANAVIHKQKGK